eukprot:GHVN01083484.1.p1 GENE.GHVN01083484.1~~GHVN01083484.1.p1  ORF type:complete len:286 (-),score=18.61 GHVN01083484.1:108-965(-)
MGRIRFAWTILVIFKWTSDICVRASLNAFISHSPTSRLAPHRDWPHLTSCNPSQHGTLPQTLLHGGKTEVFRRYKNVGGPNSFRWSRRRRTPQLTRLTGSSFITELNRERRIMAGERKQCSNPPIFTANGLFIGSVDLDMHRSDVETFFDHYYGFGSVACKLRESPDDERRHCGFGSLYFASPLHATSALLNFQGARLGRENIKLSEYYRPWFIRKKQGLGAQVSSAASLLKALIKGEESRASEGTLRGEAAYAQHPKNVASGVQLVLKLTASSLETKPFLWTED